MSTEYILDPGDDSGVITQYDNVFTHTYIAAGRYTLLAQYVDAYGRVASQSIVVYVVPPTPPRPPLPPDAGGGTYVAISDTGTYIAGAVDEIVSATYRSVALMMDAGTFYSSIYESVSQVYGVLDSTTWGYQLINDDAVEAANLFLRYDIPILHRDRYVQVTIDESMFLNGRHKVLTYGTENITYNEGKYYYGVDAILITGAVEIDTDIVDVDLICDIPIDPTYLLVKNEDFILSDNYLVFKKSPFELLPTTGSEPDRTLSFWMRSTYRDFNFVQDRLGFITRTYGKSTEGYKLFANNIVDSVMDGAGYHKTIQVICSLFDVPCTKDYETVIAKGHTLYDAWLATDKYVYRAPLHVSFLYDLGDELVPSTILTDAITMVGGNTFNSDGSLVLDRRILGLNYTGSLIFPNEDVPIEFLPNTALKTFKIIGNDADIALFWEQFYSRNALDFLNIWASGGYINPAKFIYNNALANRFMFFTIKYNDIGNESSSIINTNVIRAITPPGIYIGILTTVEYSIEDIDINVGFSDVDMAISYKLPDITTQYEITKIRLY